MTDIIKRLKSDPITNPYYTAQSIVEAVKEIERLRLAMERAASEIEDGRDSGAHLILKTALGD